MSLNKNDKTEIVSMMSEAIEVLVLPHVDEIKSDIKEMKEDIKTLKTDVAILKDDVKDLQNTTNRIETLQRSELNRVDDHELRINKLEKAGA